MENILNKKMKFKKEKIKLGLKIKTNAYGERGTSDWIQGRVHKLKVLSFIIRSDEGENREVYYSNENPKIQVYYG